MVGSPSVRLRQAGNGSEVGVVCSPILTAKLSGVLCHPSELVSSVRALKKININEPPDLTQLMAAMIVLCGVVCMCVCDHGLASGARDETRIVEIWGAACCCSSSHKSMHA